MDTKKRKICNRCIDMVATGKNIRSVAEERNFTAEDIREALNLASRQAIYRWYRGETVPTLENIGRLECIFEVDTIDELIVFTEPACKDD